MTKNNSGYLYFSICNKKLEKVIKYKQHRFVYEVFVGPIPRCFEVDHINNIRTDDRLKNLRLLTHKQNIEKSEKKNRAIISTCIETGEEKRFISIKTAAFELDIGAGNISKVCRKNVNFYHLKKMEKIYI